MNLEQVSEKANAMRDALSSVIVGQQHVIDQAVIATIASGHVLLEGPPGTAKTLLVRALSCLLDARFQRIQFTPDLMPADIVGVNIYQPTEGTFSFRSGPVFCDLLLADEVNRAPAKTQSALLEAMQEKQVSVDGQVHPLSSIFTVFATQNPIEYEGTYPLPEAQLDRFMFKILVDYPQKQQEQKILEQYEQGFNASDTATFGLNPLVDPTALQQMRDAIRTVRMSPEVMGDIMNIVQQTREDAQLSLGASPRAAVMLLFASKTLACMEGRDYVIPDDVRDLAVATLRHRVMISAESEIDGTTTDEILQAMLEQIPVPRL